MVVDGKEGESYDATGKGSLAFSPDSEHTAYLAKVGDKVLVVVDGTEGKPYDGIAGGSLIFSPDSKRVVYGAFLQGKAFVVVDGQEGKSYDGIITSVGGGIIFDSPDSFHYLAVRDSSVYLVEEKIAR